MSQPEVKFTQVVASARVGSIDTILGLTKDGVVYQWRPARIGWVPFPMRLLPPEEF